MSSIERKLKNGMTVEDLMFELEGMDPQAVVMFACDYGDRARTMQALTITNIAAMPTAVLKKTAYSQSGLCLDEELRDDVEFGDQDIPESDNGIVVLS